MFSSNMLGFYLARYLKEYHKTNVLQPGSRFKVTETGKTLLMRTKKGVKVEEKWPWQRTVT